MNFMTLLEGANASGYSWLHIDETICITEYGTGVQRYVYPSFVQHEVLHDWSFHLSHVVTKPSGIVICRREPIPESEDFLPATEVTTPATYCGPIEYPSVRMLEAAKWDIISVEKWWIPLPEETRTDPLKRGGCVLLFRKGQDLLGIEKQPYLLTPTRRDLTDMTLSVGEMVAIEEIASDKLTTKILVPSAVG